MQLLHKNNIKPGGVATEDSYFPSVLCSIPISECLVARALVMVQRLFDSHYSCRLNTEFWLGQMNFRLFCLITENNLMVLKQCVFDTIAQGTNIVLRSFSYSTSPGTHARYPIS